MKEKINDLGLNYQLYCKKSLKWVTKYYSEQTFKLFDEIMDTSSSNLKLIKFKLDQPDLINYLQTN